MADRSKSDTSKTVKNPLLSAASSGFPSEKFSASAFLMPVSQNTSSVLSEGEQTCLFLYLELLCRIQLEFRFCNKMFDCYNNIPKLVAVSRRKLLQDN